MMCLSHKAGLSDCVWRRVLVFLLFYSLSVDIRDVVLVVYEWGCFVSIFFSSRAFSIALFFLQSMSVPT
jgi:hypothetical protein